MPDSARSKLNIFDLFGWRTLTKGDRANKSIYKSISVTRYNLYTSLIQNTAYEYISKHNYIQERYPPAQQRSKQNLKASRAQRPPVLTRRLPNEPSLVFFEILAEPSSRKPVDPPPILKIMSCIASVFPLLLAEDSERVMGVIF